MQAILALEDGRVFEGESFSEKGSTTGEICFNTSMTGYQEVLTDPSYAGQIVAMTYPLIGNYGIAPSDDESIRPFVRGFVIEELCATPSNWRSRMSLEEFLAKWNVIGIQGIDTRALTRHLRMRGAMKACLTTELSAEAAVKAALENTGVVGMDFSSEVATQSAYDWDPEDELSRAWKLVHGSGEPKEDDYLEALPEPKHRIVAIDYGIKRNILRRLRQEGFLTKVLPATASVDDVLRSNPDGIFLSNGPGDPAALPYAHATLRELVGRRPIFGICLGHQLLSYAYGGKTFKLKFGHRGGNQPVKDLRTGKVSITSQNHGFAVDPDSLPKTVEVTHVNLNDGTVEGMRHKNEPVFSVQYHPEAAPGPNDASYFFKEFAKLIDQTKSTS
jgi:carbamoyl-phosphate synthase small subunit